MPTTDLVKIEKRINDRLLLEAPLLKQMGITLEAYQRVFLNAMVLNPALAECDLVSLEQAMVIAINCGLVPDNHQAAILPFNDRKSGKKIANFQPMIEGKRMLARQATPGLYLRDRIVYTSDKLEYEEGLKPVLKHTPKPGNRTDADVVAAYAISIIPGSPEPEYEVMFREDLDRYRAYSRSGPGGPWDKFYVEMCRKTVMSQLLKRLPRSSRDPGEPPAGLEGYELDPSAYAVADVMADAPAERLSEPTRPTQIRRPRQAPSPPPEDAPSEGEQDDRLDKTTTDAALQEREGEEDNPFG